MRVINDRIVSLGIFEVAGVAYRTTAQFLYRVDELDELKLVREPDNSADSNAIRVHVVKDDRDYHIGYVPATVARALAPMMDAGMPLAATVDICAPQKPMVTMSIYVPKTG